MEKEIRELPLISVIMPVYNSTYYLKKSVGSIIQQTYRNLEIILVNDGSTDKSGLLCDEFAAKDDRIRVIQQFNSGVSSARNAALAVAGGKYVCFIDADDWLPPHAIEKLYLGISEKTDSDFCFGAVTFIGLLSSQRLEAPDSTVRVDGDEESYLSMISTLQTLPAPWGKLYKMEIIRDHRICFPEDVQYSEDFLFLWDYIDHCSTFTFISDEVYDYSCIVSTNASHRFFDQAALWEWKSVVNLERLLMKKNITENLWQINLLHFALSKFIVSCKHYVHFLNRKEAVLQIGKTIQIFEEYLDRMTDAKIIQSQIPRSKTERDIVSLLGRHDKHTPESVFDCLYQPSRRMKHTVRKILTPAYRFLVYQCHADRIFVCQKTTRI